MISRALQRILLESECESLGGKALEVGVCFDVFPAKVPKRLSESIRFSSHP